MLLNHSESCVWNLVGKFSTKRGFTRLVMYSIFGAQTQKEGILFVH